MSSRSRATDSQIIEAYLETRSARAVRRQLGVARRTVASCLKRAKIKQTSSRITPKMAKDVIAAYKVLGSIRAVVRELGICHKSAKKCIVDAGLGKDGFLFGYKLPFKTRTIKVSDEELTRLYQKYESTGEIAKVLGCTAGGVAARLRNAGIEMHGNERTQFKKGQPSPRRTQFDNAELERLYDELMSARAVAEVFGCSEEAVKSALKRSGKMRNPSEAKKLLYSDPRNHPSWKGGGSFDPYPVGWNHKFKEVIRKRDEYTCVLCSKPEASCRRQLSVHHIDYDKENLDPGNLVSLCISCHLSTNTDREFWAEWLGQMMANYTERVSA